MQKLAIIPTNNAMHSQLNGLYLVAPIWKQRNQPNIQYEKKSMKKGGVVIRNLKFLSLYIESFPDEFGKRIFRMIVFYI